MWSGPRGLVLLLSYCFSLCQAAAAGDVVEERPPEAVMQELRGAMRNYSKELNSKTRFGVRPGLVGTRAFFVIGGKSDPRPVSKIGQKIGIIPCVVPGPVPGDSSLAANGIIIIDNNPGIQEAQRRLMRAVRMFERSAGPNTPRVRACRAQEGQCMQKCRSAARQAKVTGQCSCIGVRAHCLNSIRFKGTAARNMRRLPGLGGLPEYPFAACCEATGTVRHCGGARRIEFMGRSSDTHCDPAPLF